MDGVKKELTDLMNIQVHNKDLADCSSLKQDLAGDCKIIQDAETRAKAWKGVVGSPGSVAGEAVLQGKLCCQQCTCAPPGLLQVDEGQCVE